MFFIVLLSISIISVLFFVVMFFTLTSHFERISLPDNGFEMNSKAINIYKKGGVLILIAMFLFLALIFI